MLYLGRTSFGKQFCSHKIYLTKTISFLKERIHERRRKIWIDPNTIPRAHLRPGKHKRKQRLKVQNIGSLPLPLECRQGLSHEWQNTSSPSKMVKWQIIFENQISHLYECLESIWPTDVRKWSMTLVIYGPICLFPYPLPKFLPKYWLLSIEGNFPDLLVQICSTFSGLTSSISKWNAFFLSGFPLRWYFRSYVVTLLSLKIGSFHSILTVLKLREL